MHWQIRKYHQPQRGIVDFIDTETCLYLKLRWCLELLNDGQTYEAQLDASLTWAFAIALNKASKLKNISIIAGIELLTFRLEV